MSSQFPSKVSQLLQNFDGWLIGSAANPDNQNPRDFDILIPFHMWHKACLSIPENAIPNSFGGWKFIDNNVEIDMWPGDLSYLAARPRFKYAYHLASDTRISKI